MSIGKTITRVAEVGVGLYLILPSIEDAATGGITLVPSAILGAGMVAHGLGMKMPKFY